MNSTNYDKRITFLSNVEIDDNMGGAVLSYSEIITVWASIEAMPSRQQLEYAAITTNQGYNIECRELKTKVVDANCSLRYNGQVFIIHSLVEKNHKLLITAFER